MSHIQRKQLISLCAGSVLLLATHVARAQDAASTSNAEPAETAATPTEEAAPAPEAARESQASSQTDGAAPSQANANDAPHALIRHLPLNDTLIGDTRFVFDVNSPDHLGTIVVCVLPDGNLGEVRELEAAFNGTQYVAVLAANRVTPQGFSYYVIERMPDGNVRAVFADAATPHYVRATWTDAEELEQQRLRARDGRRSTVWLAGEGVDYGDRKLAAGQPSFHDRYYKLEIGYGHAFLRTIEEVRISLVRVRGQAALHDAQGELSGTEVALGIDYGRAAVTLLAHPQFRLRGAVLLGASQRGFEYGVAGAIVIGDPLRENLDLGFETLTTLGTVGHLRLGFAALERVPMGAAIEVSSFPVGEDAGVRLLYDVGYRFNAITSVVLRGGYQARTSVTGGASLGLTLNYGF